MCDLRFDLRFHQMFDLRFDLSDLINLIFLRRFCVVQRDHDCSEHRTQHLKS